MPSAAQVVAAGSSYGRGEALAGQAVQRGVHLGQPDRAAAPRPHPVGRGRRRARPGAGRRRRRGVARVLHQRPRQPDGQVRCLARGRRRWAAGARGRLPRRLRRATSPSRSSPTSPGILDLPEGERLVAFREAGYRAPAGRPAGRSSTRSARTSTSGSPSARLHDERRGRARPSRSCERQGHLFEADGALWMRTTDFGDDKDRVLRRGNGELTYFASRHRLLRRQARARLRRLHLPARRRPPRLRRPAQGDGGVRRRRPGVTTSRC